MNFRAKILVIEEDLQTKNKILNELLLKGYDNCCIDNGALGIKKAFEYNPDLVLCSVRMETVDGFQVYKILKESYLTDRVPFIFMTDKADLKDIRKGMNLGADDYLVKPFDSTELINVIEVRLSKFSKLKEVGRNELKALSNLTPNGIFLFDGHLIFEANAAFIKIFGFQDESVKSFSLDDFLVPLSQQRVKEDITRCTHGLMDTLREEVTFMTRSGEKFEGSLYVSVYEKFSGYALMAGLVIPKKREHVVMISDILKVLRKENIIVNKSLEEKLTEVFKQGHVSGNGNGNGNGKSHLNDFFSERENQVLSLSMEGLPTKLIADKLSISNRTVEKHRAKLMEKTNSKNMIEVIIYAFRNNLLNI